MKEVLNAEDTKYAEFRKIKEMLNTEFTKYTEKQMITAELSE